MNDGSPTLEIGFAIDFGNSFGQLRTLDDLVGEATASTIREFNRIEAAAKTISFADTTASISAFASTTSAAFNKAEQAAERMTARLVEQAETFGMTRAAAAAWRAEQVGATSAAEALLAAEGALNALRESERQTLVAASQAYTMFEAAAQRGAAAMREADAAAKALDMEAQAQALRSATQAYNMFEAAARRGIAAMRDEDAAAKSAALETQAQALRSATQGYNMFEAAARRASAAAADVAAKEASMAAGASELRASIDPMFAAQQRFDAELTRADQLLAAGVIAQREYDQATQHARDTLYSHAQAVAGSSAAEDVLVKTHGRMSVSGMEMMHVVRASSDAFAAGAPLMQIFSMEMGRVAQAAAAVGGGTGALGKMGAFLGGGWGIALTVGIAVLGPLVAKLWENDDAAKAAADSMKKFQDRQGDIKNFIDETTGALTEQNRTLVLNATLTRQAQIAANAKSVTDSRDKAFAAANAVHDANPAYAGISSAGSPIISQLTDPKVAAIIKASGSDVGKLADGLARLAQTSGDKRYADLALNVSNLGGAAVLAQRENAKLSTELRALGGDTTALAGHTSELINKQVALATATTPLEKARAQLALVEAGGTAATKAGGAALEKYRADLTGAMVAVHSAEAAQKAASAAQRDANKEATLAAKLAREGSAVDAQIANTYKLAEAYGVSGAAALIAEARVKAESQAIKERGDVEAFVARQVALAVAQRVADAAKGTAAMRDQADIQDKVNAEVAAGNVPAQLAAEMVRARMADLPLLAAIEAATATGNVQGAQKATDALDAQRAARDRLTDSEREAWRVATIADGEDQLAQLAEEARLIGATDAARVHALATLKATQEAVAKGLSGKPALEFVDQKVKIADDTQANKTATDAYNLSLARTADLLSVINDNAQNTASMLSNAFGGVGDGVGKALTALTGYAATQAKLDQQHTADQKKYAQGSVAMATLDIKYAKESATAKAQATGQAIDGIKNLFDEHSKAYKVMQGVEEVYAAFQAAETIASIARDLLKTSSSLANSSVRTTANTAEGASKIFSELGPWAFPVVAAMIALIASLGFKGGGGSVAAPPTSDDIQKTAGTGTVLGSPNDKSASIANSLDLVAKNSTGNLQYSNQMLISLKSIDVSIGAMATTVAKQINVSGSAFDTTKLNLGSSGSAGFLGLFSSSTTRTLYDAGITLAASTVGNIVAKGIAGQTYQIVEQVKKSSGFLGIGGGTKTTYSTTSGALPSDITASIRSVIGALETGIVTAAGAIGINGAKAMLDKFNVNIGKVSFNGLDAQGIEDQLNAIFSTVGDQMTAAVLPGIAKFQKVGEGLLETLERVASTTVAVDAELEKLGATGRDMGIDVAMGIASMFDSVSDFTSAADAYFTTFYTSAEQTASKAAQMQQLFASLNLTMPDTLAGFRSLVEAQDLTTTAGQSTYATLLKVAPAFAELQQSLNGAKSAADALSEKQDLQRQLLEAQGNTAAIRALDLQNIDATNRALQLQVWAAQDAKTLADAWTSVGDTITTEINRIRGLTDTNGDSGFASLLGQFNAATASARSGNQDAAKLLPGLSQSLLSAAALIATSRQELARIQAQTAASLETTNDAINVFANGGAPSTAETLSAAATASQANGAGAAAANDDMASAIQALRDEVSGLRADSVSGFATVAANTGKLVRQIDDVTAGHGGTAMSVANAA